MKVNYQYASPSVCVNGEDGTTLGLSPDMSRDEAVSFLGKLKHPLVFRDAMLMLRQIVITDAQIQKKERKEFFMWLDEEIERRSQQHQNYLPSVRTELRTAMEELNSEVQKKESEAVELMSKKKALYKKIEKLDAWHEYYKIEREFWNFIRERDSALWFVLDPVITVHPDQISFEAFSLDESVYGCLSIAMEEFELLQEPKLGTTNIDFSAGLAKEIEKFRTYKEVKLSVNPDGFTAASGTGEAHIEKKIDLPETWIKGFNQVSSAANLQGIDIELMPADMYDICCFLRRHKANKSPRYMKWILKKNEPVKILLEPFQKTLILQAIYRGDKNREEKIWGRRRWLTAEKLIPLASSFQIKLLGFGMPQFIIANLGKMKMTIGFSSWSSNDWVKGTAFSIMNGFIGDGNYKEVYTLLKKNRFMSLDAIYAACSPCTEKEVRAGIGSLLKRGEGYYDAAKDLVRFRKLCSQPIPEELYQTTPIELEVKALIDTGLERFSVRMTEKGEYVFTNFYQTPNPKYKNDYYYGTEDFHQEYNTVKAELAIDEDGQICRVWCECKEFRKGSRNISSPCAHILALYLVSVKFTRLNLETDREYKINDIMEMVL